MTHVKTRWFVVAVIVPYVIATVFSVIAGGADSMAVKRGATGFAIVLACVGFAAVCALVTRLVRESIGSYREKKWALGSLRVIVGIVLLLGATAVGLFAIMMLGFLLFWES